MHLHCIGTLRNFLAGDAGFIGPEIVFLKVEICTNLS